MFKVIRDFVPQAQFFILCDRACGQFVSVLVADAPQTLDATQAAWAAELITQGWRITLAEHVCPLHVKQEREGKSLLVIPNMAAARLRN